MSALVHSRRGEPGGPNRVGDLNSRGLIPLRRTGSFRAETPCFGMSMVTWAGRIPMSTPGVVLELLSVTVCWSGFRFLLSGCGGRNAFPSHGVVVTPSQ
jgi:hypothetical protein